MKDTALATRETGAVDVMPEVPPDNILAIIAQAAKNPAMDVEKMERLLALHERVLARQAEQAFNDAMRHAQAEMPRITKDAKNPSTNSRYVQLETLNKAALPVYTRHGFSLQFSEGDSPTAPKIRVLCKVSHQGGHSCTHHLDLSPDDMGAKGNANKTKIHGEGSTFSYGRRYLTCLIFNMTLVNEDDDGNAGGGRLPAQGPMRATEKTRTWFISQIQDIKPQTFQYFIDNGIIMPNDPLESIPLEHVPVSKAQLDELRKKILA